MIGFRIHRTYYSIIRYSSYEDLLKMGKAMGVAFILAIIAHYLLKLFPPYIFFPIKGYEILIIYVLSTFFIWFIRILIKNIYDVVFVSEEQMQTLVYGISDQDINFAKSINSKRGSSYKLEGFLSPDIDKKRYSFLGKPVYVINEENLEEKIKKNKIRAVVVLPSNIETFRTNNKLVDTLLDNGVRIYQYIGTDEVDPQKGFKLKGFKEFCVEDLLPRDIIDIDIEAIREKIQGTKILVTGAAGSIGHELVKIIATLNPQQIVLVDQAETPLHDLRLEFQRLWPNLNVVTEISTITDENHMRYLFKTYNPYFVFHAAAYKHVPMMEDNPCESVHNNILGTKILADLSVEFMVHKFVMISTDKAVNPTNIMGCSKRICEKYVQSLDLAEKNGLIKGTTQFITTRFGNVLGSNGSVIPLFEKQIQEGGPVTVTDPNIVRFFMLISEACKLVLEAAIKGKGGEIFVFDMGKPVKIVDLAKLMIQISGRKDVKITFTGLRPGEKLYEEVLADDEKSIHSDFNDKIRIANIREYDFKKVRYEIETLISLSSLYDKQQTVSKMKEIVPEFNSSNKAYASR